MATKLTPAGRVFVGYTLSMLAAIATCAALAGCDAAPEELEHRAGQRVNPEPVRTNPSPGILLTNGTAYDGKVAIPDLVFPADVHCTMGGLDPVELSCEWECGVTVTSSVAFPPEGTEIRVEFPSPCGVAL